MSFKLLMVSCHRHLCRNALLRADACHHKLYYLHRSFSLYAPCTQSVFGIDWRKRQVEPAFLLGSHVRYLRTGNVLWEKESSKVEQTVKAIKEVSQKTKPETQPGSPAVVEAPAAPKRSLMKRIWDELVHYYHGFRLLFVDIKVSSKLVYRVLRGTELTRREHKQLVRTVSDLFRLVPFSVFIIVPFMEFLLPIVLKLFPGMLPSTFQTDTERDTKIKKELKVKLEMAKFLQDTLDEMSLDRKGEKHSETAKEFTLFFDKIRRSGEQATNEEIMKFSKLFEDEITLDSLSRPQLIALCRLLELQPIGTNNFLRFQLRMKLRSLKADDQMIYKEGIETLTIPELQSACRARGMRALGVPEDRLRFQLAQWLELSFNEKIPPSLLLLSRALYLPENLAASDQLKATISSLPDTAATEAKYKIGEKEGKVDNKTKIELIKLEEEEIKKERAEQKQQEEIERLEKEIEAGKAIPEVSASDILHDVAPTMVDKAKELEPEVAKAEKGKEFTKEDFDDIEDAIENISKEKKRLLIEEEELEDLKEDMADYKEDIEEFKEVTTLTGETKLRETKAATRLYKKVNSMITQMDKLMDNLKEEQKTLQTQIDDKTKEGVSAEKERDNIIGINELLLAIRRLQKSSDDVRLQRIADVLGQLDEDHDGAVDVDDVVKVIELLGRENVKVTSEQMKDILDLLQKEEILETVEKREKQKERTQKTTEQQQQQP